MYMLRRSVPLGYPRASTVHGRDETTLLEYRHCLPDGLPSDAVLLDEGRLAREPATGGKLAAAYLAFDEVGQLQVERLRTLRIDRHGLTVHAR